MLRSAPVGVTIAQRSADLQTLLAEAEAVAGKIGGGFDVFDPADPRFVSPGDMPTKIVGWYFEHDLRPPGSPAEVVRCILESLAEAYARTIKTAETLAGGGSGRHDPRRRRRISE